MERRLVLSWVCGQAIYKGALDPPSSLLSGPGIDILPRHPSTGRAAKHPLTHGGERP